MCYFFSHSVRSLGLLSYPQSVTINNKKTKNETQTSPAAFDIHPWCMCTYIPSIIAQGATSRVELIDILLTRRFLFVCIWCESEVLLRLGRNVRFAVLCSHERLLRMLPCCRISPLASILNVDQSCRSSVILGGGERKQKWRFDRNALLSVCCL